MKSYEIRLWFNADSYIPLSRIEGNLPSFNHCFTIHWFLIDSRSEHEEEKERKRGFRRLFSGMVSSIRNVITGVIPIETSIPLTDCVAARGMPNSYITIRCSSFSGFSLRLGNGKTSSEAWKTCFIYPFRFQKQEKTSLIIVSQLFLSSSALRSAPFNQDSKKLNFYKKNFDAPAAFKVSCVCKLSEEQDLLLQ